MKNDKKKKYMQQHKRKERKQEHIECISIHLSFITLLPPPTPSPRNPPGTLDMRPLRRPQR